MWRRNPTRALAASLLKFIDHTDTQHSVGLLWTRNQPIAETLPDNTQHSQATDIHAPGRIRTRKPNKQAAADLRLRLRGHRERQLTACKVHISFSPQETSRVCQDVGQGQEIIIVSIATSSQALHLQGGIFIVRQ
jgi:hypothetical protein